MAKLPAPSVYGPGGSMYDFSVLRTLRKRSGTTLDEVSQQSGVSLSVISKLERNQTRAELETLYKLGRVFGMTASDLLAMAEAPFAQVARERRYEASSFNFRRINYGNADCLLGAAPAGAKTSRPDIHQDDHEICWILEGRIRLTLPHESHDLGEGESLQFDAVQQHTYEALEDSRFIIIHLRKRKRF